MSQTLGIDFETHSKINLPIRGAYRYARDLSTGIYVMGYAFDDQDVQVWVPGRGEPFPASIEAHILAGGKIDAWNAAFERLLSWYVLCPDYDVPEPALEQFRCTAARARAHGLPGKLDDCTRALSLPISKHAEGRRLILSYSVNNTPWDEIPEADQELWIDYVKSDVDAERMIGQCLRQLTDEEWAEYHLNERVNDRGVPVDLDFAEAAYGYADEVREDVAQKLSLLTGGKVTKATERKSRDEWVLPQLNEEQIDLISVYKNDEKKITFDVQHREALMVHPDLPRPVERYLELIDEAGGATIGKYKAMLKRSEDLGDGPRMRGALMFNGAGQTGRFSSTGIQLHNLSRASLDDPESIIATVVEGEYEIDDVTDTLKKAVRAAIYSPSGMSWYDFSSIEGRVAPWLEGGALGEAKLDLYREGVDPYVYNAARTFGISMDEVTKDQRQAGKIQELSLSFLGGVGALKVMGRGFGMHIDDEWGLQLRDAWRRANPWAQKYGRDLEKAVRAAVKDPGNWKDAGRVDYAYDGKDWLWCRLPSGRLIAYFQPRYEEVITPWGEPRMAVTTLWGGSKPKVGEEWPRRALHGGIMLENVTQATAADLLREAIARVDAAELKILLHVHDEIVVEGYHTEQLGQLMLASEPWAHSLPLAGEGGEGQRYGK